MSGRARGRNDRRRDLYQVAAAVIGSAAAAQVVDPVMTGQAATHTYETSAVPGATETPHQLDVVGANGRRLIMRWVPEGVWVGGCLITDQDVAGKLAAFITRENES